MLARIENNAVAEYRDIQMADIAEHKRGPWRAVVTLGEGPQQDIVITSEAVTITRSYAKADLVAHARAKRDAVIDAGCTVAGIPVWGDLKTQSTLGTMVLGAQINQAQVISFVCRDGVTRELDAAQTMAVALGLMGWVQLAYGTYSDLLTWIETGDVDEPHQIDTAEWPSNV